jgi:dihydroorotate dehydrogenase electron transfer subunit
MRTVAIANVRDECADVKSFTFSDRLCANAEPGQFVMIWIPGVDEVPMSLSRLNPAATLAAVTVKRVGEATAALHRLKAGGVIGVRGPFGRGYDISRFRKVMIVGGGTGVASLAPLVELLVKRKREITLMLGAKSRDELLFLDRLTSLSRVKSRVVVTTEDASYGLQGLVTTQVENSLPKRKEFDMIYACGPERMMHKMFLLSKRFSVHLQVSLERFMRCAIGICGTCLIGRYRVCRDGPVFSSEQLLEVEDEFGHFRLGFDGQRLPV